MSESACSVLSVIDSLGSLYQNQFQVSAEDPFLKSLGSLQVHEERQRQARGRQPSMLMWLGWTASDGSQKPQRASTQQTEDEDARSNLAGLKHGFVRLAESLPPEEVTQTLGPAWSHLQQSSALLPSSSRPFPEYKPRDDSERIWRSNVGGPWVNFDLKGGWTEGIDAAACRLHSTLVEPSNPHSHQAVVTAQVLQSLCTCEVSDDIWGPGTAEEVISHLTGWQQEVEKLATEDAQCIHENIETVLPACQNLFDSVKTAKEVRV